MPLKIVIAEDFLDTAEMLAEYFSAAGHAVFICRDGLQAMAALQSEAPDFAILDIGMPKLTGLEVVRRAKAEPWGKDIIYVGLSGHGSAADFKAAKIAGFDYYLVKPPDFDVLDEIFASVKQR